MTDIASPWFCTRCRSRDHRVDACPEPDAAACCSCDPMTCEADESGDHCIDRSCGYCLHGCPAGDAQPCCLDAAPPLDVTCPTCAAQLGQRCKTLTTARTTDTHNDRYAASWEWRARNATGRRLQEAPEWTI